MRYVLAAVAALALSDPSRAETGAQLLEACRDLVAGLHSDNATADGITVPSSFGSGQCMGAMQMLQTLGNIQFQGENKPALALCVPTEVRSSQYARIVLKYLQDHPEALHQDGNYLAYLAINSAFPCKNDGN